jgi:hypothetical protein
VTDPSESHEPTLCLTHTLTRRQSCQAPAGRDGGQCVTALVSPLIASSGEARHSCFKNRVVPTDRADRDCTAGAGDVRNCHPLTRRWRVPS